MQIKRIGLGGIIMTVIMFSGCTGRLIQHRVILMRKRLGMQSKSQVFQEKKSSLQQRCGLNIMDMKKQRNQFLNP